MITPSIADLFAAQISDLKNRSDETNRSIREHLTNAKKLAADLAVIDADFPEDS
jgi:hypothetical protein